MSEKYRRQPGRGRRFQRQSGVYLVTICTKDRVAVFGQVVDGRMVLNTAGEAVSNSWRELPERFPAVALDALVLMPDHLHGIVILRRQRGAHYEESEAGVSGPTLADVLGAFKSVSTVLYMRGVRDEGWKPFCGKLWQPGYHARSLRNERSLSHARRYIENNPMAYELATMRSKGYGGSL